MADAWFVGRGGERSGPFAADALREMAASGRLAPTDLVWSEGMAVWAPAASLPGLFTTSPPPVAGSPSDNPYAAPATNRDGPAPVAGDRTALELATQPYSFAAAFALAFHTFRRRWATLVYLGLLMIIVGVVLAIPQVALVVAGLALGVNPNDAAGRALLAWGPQLVGWVTNVLVGGPVFAGFVLAAANVTCGRGRRGDLLLGFRRFGTVVLASLMVFAISMGGAFVAILPVLAGGLAVAALGPQGNPGPVGVAVFLGGVAGSLALLLAFAVVMARVSFTPIIAADPDLGLDLPAAVRLNWSRVTIGRAFSLGGLLLVAGILLMLSIAVLCVGLVLIGMPLWTAVLGAAYQLLFRGGRAAIPAR